MVCVYCLMCVVFFVVEKFVSLYFVVMICGGFELFLLCDVEEFVEWIDGMMGGS